MLQAAHNRIEDLSGLPAEKAIKSRPGVAPEESSPKTSNGAELAALLDGDRRKRERASDLESRRRSDRLRLGPRSLSGNVAGSERRGAPPERRDDPPRRGLSSRPPRAALGDVRKGAPGVDRISVDYSAWCQPMPSL